LKRARPVVKVRVEDVAVLIARPKVTQVTYQFAILTRDEFGHARTFFVDADKYDEGKFTLLVKGYYAGRYGIKVDDVELEWVVKPPKVEVRK